MHEQELFWKGGKGEALVRTVMRGSDEQEVREESRGKRRE